MPNVEIDRDQPKSLEADRSMSRRGIGIGVVRLGDAIKALTGVLGIKPCAECEKRAARLNVVFSLRAKPKSRQP